jgi:hypothetical protein
MVLNKTGKIYINNLSGRGSVRLERLVRDQEVGGSNPLAPTMGNSVYILYSTSKDKYYIGQTDCLERRVKEHSSGLCISTKAGRPRE